MLSKDSNGKMIIKKLCKRYKNKTWNNPQIKTLIRALNSDVLDHRHDLKI